MSFAQAEYAGKEKTTRRERFLAQMEQVVPWSRLVALIEPHYPKGQARATTRGHRAHVAHFGMKAHIGADASSGLVHTVVGTAANVSDISQTHELLHGQEQTVHADAGYIGVEKRAEIIARHEEVEWRIAQRRGKLKAMPESWIKDLTLGYEKLKARVRALVEHPFHVIKNLFKHRKVRYRGLRKNTAHLHSLFALANLVIARKRLLAAA